MGGSNGFGNAIACWHCSWDIECSRAHHIYRNDPAKENDTATRDMVHLDRRSSATFLELSIFRRRRDDLDSTGRRSRYFYHCVFKHLVWKGRLGAAGQMVFGRNTHKRSALDHLPITGDSAGHQPYYRRNLRSPNSESRLHRTETRKSAY